MKRCYLIMALSLLFLACSNSGTSIEINEDGSKVIRYFENKGDTQNYYKEYYYPNGQIGATGQFKNGEMAGKWEWYYENGAKKDQAYLENGLYTNRRTHWHDNGNLKLIEIINVPCSKECCDGMIRSFDTLGRLTQEYFIIDGKVNDTLTYYYSSGRVFKKSIYKDDERNGHYIEYHKNGNIWVEGQFINGEMVGEWNWYDTSGILERTEIAGE